MMSIIAAEKLEVSKPLTRAILWDKTLRGENVIYMFIRLYSS